MCVSGWLWGSGWSQCARYYCSGILPRSLCQHHASGQHQLSQTEGKHQNKLVGNLSWNGAFACDAVVCLICLDMVGPYWAWATVWIIVVLTQLVICFIEIRQRDGVGGRRTEGAEESDDDVDDDVGAKMFPHTLLISDQAKTLFWAKIV